MAGSAVVGILRALLTSNAAEFSREMGIASGSVRNFARDTGRMARQATNVGRALTQAFTIPIAVGTGAVAKLAIDFESSFAGVRKTVDATEEQFADLAQGFRDMSKEIPINVNELNRIGEAAGQLGIKTENILAFTDTMAKLGVTTNLSSEEAATSLARLANITQMPQTQFDRLGSSIVSLGNNFATTEQEIVEMGLRLAGAGNQIGLSEDQILALGAAMSSTGIRAEAGGTAMSRVMVEIASAVAMGSDAASVFADVALPGVADSAERFSQMFRDDAAGALQLFIEGLGKVEDKGHDIFGVLEDLGFGNVRVRDTMLRLAGAGDLVARSFENSAEAWAANTALTAEAEERFKTTASQLTLLWNRIKDVGITLGNALLPMIQASIRFFDQLVPLLEGAANLFASLPLPIQATGVAFLGIVAAAGPLIWLFGQLAFGASSIATAFTANGVATQALTAATSGLSKAYGFLAPALNLIRGAFALVSGAVLGVSTIFGAVMAAVFTATGTWDEFGRILSAVGSIVRDVVGVAFDSLVRTLSMVKTAVAGAFQSLRDGIASSPLVQEFVARFSRGMTRIAGALETAASDVHEWRHGTEELTDATITLLDPMDALVGVGRRLGAEVLPAVARSAEEMAAAGQALIDRALTPLTGAQEQWILRLNETGVSMKEIAEVTGATQDQIRLFLDRVKQAEERLKELRAAEEDLLVVAPKLKLSFEEMLLAAGKPLAVISQSSIEAIPAIQGVGSAFDHLLVPVVEAERGIFRVRDLLANLGTQLGTPPPPTFFAAMGAQMRNFIRDDLGGIILGAIQGGGDIGRAIGASIFGEMFSAEGVLGPRITQGLSNLFGNTIGGVLGSLVPGIGTLLGSLLGSVLGKVTEFFGNLFGGRSLADNLQRDGRNMGLQLSEGFMAALAEQEDRFGNNAGRAIMANLAAALEDAGGVLEVGLERSISLTRDLFSFFERGEITFQELGDNFNTIFAELLPHSIDEATGQIRPDFLELIDLARRFGVESENMQEAIEGSMARLDEVLKQREQLMTDVATSGADALNRLVESGFGQTQNQINVVGASAVAMFNQMIAGGMSFAEALQAFGPSLGTLAERIEELGLQASPAFQTLLDGANIFADEGLSKIANRGIAAGDVLQSLITLGQVSQRDFNVYGRTITRSFDQLVAGGVSGEAALMALRPQIALLIRLQEEYGLEVDDATQELIDQGKEAGITADEAKSAAEIQKEAYDKIIAALQQIVTLLGGVEQGVENLDGKEADVNVNVNVDDSELQKLPSEVTIPAHVDEGGIRDGQVSRQFGSPNLDFENFGSETEARLHGDEAVIPRGSGHQLADEIARGLAPLIAGGGGGGGNSVTWVVNAIDADGVRSAMPTLARQFIEFVERNDDGSKSNLRRSLNLD